MVHPIYAQMPTTVFEEMSGLARSLGAVNLGQGFPDDPGPEAIRSKAADAILKGDDALLFSGPLDDEDAQ